METLQNEKRVTAFSKGVFSEEINMTRYERVYSWKVWRNDGKKNS